MSIVFYAGSGSVPAWKVWLSLEHKQIPYELKLLSFSAREHKAPEFLAINPRGRVPTITDGDFVCWESTVIVEYLEERWPERPLLPKGARERARVRRLAMEAQLYLGRAVDSMGEATFLARDGKRNEALIEEGRAAAAVELARHEEELDGAFFGGESPSMADFTTYPIMAMMQRISARFGVAAVAIGPRLTAWMKRIEALPYFERAYPPHWKG